MLGGGIFDWDLELSKCLLSTLEGEAHIEEGVKTAHASRKTQSIELLHSNFLYRSYFILKR